MQEPVKLERSLLRDQAAEILRDHISTGRIPEGTRLKQQDVSKLLGISRMPARDALMLMQAEGLVESRADGLHVTELNEQDVRDLHQVRWTLEKLAVELAAARMSEENGATLTSRIHDLEEAVASGDPALCAKHDMAIHQEIWRQADNGYLYKVLNSILGVIFVLASRVQHYQRRDPIRLLDEHRELVTLIVAGEGAKAAQMIEDHLRYALTVSLRSFYVPEGAMAPHDSSTPPFQV
jgi:DNA-binding GntR family transcriptional regulator